MSRGRCYVEVDDNRKPIRIFKNAAMARVSEAWDRDRVTEVPRAEAAKAIRETVFQRAEHRCEKCGTRLTWEMGHMDEKVSRGEGGEMSVFNSWLLCASCHILHPDSEHGNRRWGGRQ